MRLDMHSHNVRINPTLWQVRALYWARQKAAVLGRGSKKMTRDLNLRRHVRATSSWSVIGLLIAAAPSIAYAQEAANDEAVPESGQAVESAPEATESEIVVFGSRASQQSAINRK